MTGKPVKEFVFLHVPWMYQQLIPTKVTYKRQHLFFTKLGYIKLNA